MEIPVVSIVLLFLNVAQGTDRPIIGILTQEVDSKFSSEFTSYIAASYVKAVEQSGARVAPIFINRTEKYYRKILSSVNGVVFPGGDSNFTTAGGVADAGRMIVNYAKKVNARGDNFPILGVCLGFELLLYLEVESYGILGYCDSTDDVLPLNFTERFNNSLLYRDAPQKLIDLLSSVPLTYNHHKRCVTEQLLRKYKLGKKWHVLSNSVDRNGTLFISSIESRRYPIAGVQFHPEKNAYEWNPADQFPHSPDAILTSRYFYDWFVNVARKNKHAFNNPAEETEALIYNYNVTYTGKNNYYFEQIYLFNNYKSLMLSGNNVI